jgi:hypothetical protein
MLQLPQENLIHFIHNTTELVNTLQSTYLIRRCDIQLRRNLVLHQTVDYGGLEKVTCVSKN